MKKKVLSGMLVLGLLIFLAYVLVVSAIDYFISSAGSYYVDKVIWKATLNGTTAGDKFGSSVATGDINNDSYADVIVGAYYADPSDASSAGQAYVFFGTADGISDMDITNANLTFNGTTASDYFGYSVASGDVNNDSYADIMVGAYGVSSSAGQAYVFFGADYPSTAGISYDALIDANITVNGTTNSRFGWSVASGDVNNDSYADMIGGATWASPSGSKSGQAYVFFGGVYSNAAPGAVSYNALMDGNITLNGTTGNDFFGYSVGSGDVNNDSYADVIIGAYQAPFSGSVGPGMAYVFFGGEYSNAAPGSVSYNALIDANITVNGTVAVDHLGQSVASGDVNNDGYVDIIIGADFADPSGTSSGQAYVFFGADYPNTVGISYDALIDANITVNGTATSDLFGCSVASRDVNNDSYADVIVGAYQAPYSDGSAGPGEVYIYEYDDISPVVALDAPADRSYDTDSDVNFSFTIVEYHNSDCILYFRSNATNWESNDSTTYSNSVQANIFVNLTDAVYVWNVECNDTGNNPAFASANRTLTVDTTLPTTPTVTEPLDTSINPRDSISYTCDSTDATAGISKWTWTLTKPQSGGTVTKTGGEVTSNSQTFSGDETNLAGSYTVVCEVEDKAGLKSSSSSTFAVYYSHAPGEGGGSGGAGAGPIAAAQLDFTVQEEVKIKEPQGAIMTFTLDGTAVHTIKLRKVTTSTVTIIIESTPIEITLEIGETKQVDIDGDGINDISVTLNDIIEGVVDLTTKRLTPLPKKEVPQEEVTPTEKPAEEITPEAAPSKAWQRILIIAVVIVIGAGYWFIKKKK